MPSGIISPASVTTNHHKNTRNGNIWQTIKWLIQKIYILWTFLSGATDFLRTSDIANSLFGFNDEAMKSYLRLQHHVHSSESTRKMLQETNPDAIYIGSMKILDRNTNLRFRNLGSFDDDYEGTCGSLNGKKMSTVSGYSNQPIAFTKQKFTLMRYTPFHFGKRSESYTSSKIDPVIAYQQNNYKITRKISKWYHYVVNHGSKTNSSVTIHGTLYYWKSFSPTSIQVFFVDCECDYIVKKDPKQNNTEIIEFRMLSKGTSQSLAVGVISSTTWGYCRDFSFFILWCLSIWFYFDCYNVSKSIPVVENTRIQGFYFVCRPLYLVVAIMTLSDSEFIFTTIRETLWYVNNATSPSLLWVYWTLVYATKAQWVIVLAAEMLNAVTQKFILLEKARIFLTVHTILLLTGPIAYVAEDLADLFLSDRLNTQFSTYADIALPLMRSSSFYALRAPIYLILYLLSLIIISIFYCYVLKDQLSTPTSFETFINKSRAVQLPVCGARFIIEKEQYTAFTISRAKVICLILGIRKEQNEAITPGFYTVNAQGTAIPLKTVVGTGTCPEKYNHLVIFK